MRFRIPINGKILNRVASIDHLRGVWADGAALGTERRDEVEAATVVASTIAACRLAAVAVTADRIRELLAGTESPRNSEEREVVGYARALAAPDPGGDGLLGTVEIRRLHATLMGADGGLPEPSPWRDRPCLPEAFDADGTALGRVFTTLPPHVVPDTMEDLTTWLEMELRSREHHPLLVIGTFTLGVLAANPFDAGNLRLALVLATRILVRHGYGFLRFHSVEEAVDAARERLYDAFDASQTHIWNGEADLEPWLDFFVERLESQARAVAALLDAERRASAFSPLQRAIVDTVRENGTAEAGLLIRTLGTNRNTLKDNLRRLVDRGVLEKMGERRGTRYRIAAAQVGRLPEL